MRLRKLIWQLYPTYLLITLLSLVAATWYASRAGREFFIRQTSAGLEARGRLLEPEVLERLQPGQEAGLEALCQKLGQKSATRITVILPSGKVLGDSDEDPGRMDNHGDRPEVIQALREGRGMATRFSHTLDQNMMYVALALDRDGRTAAVVRTAVSISSLDQTLRRIYLQIALGGAVIALLAAGVSLIVSRRLSRPLEEMKRGAEHFARGELHYRLAMPASEEMAGLALALNQMAQELDERLRGITIQRNEQEAILASMVEGVLALDSDQRLLSLNQAAAEMLRIKREQAAGRSLPAAVRNLDLQKFVEQALAAGEPVESELALPEGGRFLQAHGTRLLDPQGQRIGAVIVLHDITRLRRLETVRRDFVANVSHELKTPITAIKGYLETLQEGAIREPQEAGRFLEILAKQADRLNAIVDDLLSLARLEAEAEQKKIELLSGPIAPVLQAAMQSCAVSAEAKKIEIELSCAPELQARINAPLLEQAVSNLLDNAIKYSEPERKISVEAIRNESEVLIRVHDQGWGIEKEHLPRIFERFYRVDKGRSRKLGGTGLGLSIVKHIALAHGGEVQVESRPGTGSTFTICLPLI